MQLSFRVSGAVFFGCLAVSPAIAQNKPTVPLATYRAVYDLSLDETVETKGVEAAAGRLVYETTGSICEGYTVKARQMINMQTENGTHLLDSISDSYESGDGKTMRFRLESRMDDAPIESTRGEAIIGDDAGLRIRLSRPQAKNKTWKGTVLLPTMLSEQVIAAARSGQATFSARTYDGTAGGETVYDTLTIIGHRIEPGATTGLEEAAQAPELKKLARWPVKISYFKHNAAGSGEPVPDYSMAAELYENGITRAMRLNFKEFAAKAELKSVTFLPASACKKR